MRRGFSRIAGLLPIFSSVLTLASSAAAVTMDFDTVGNNVAVGNFYNGAGGAENNFGVSFSLSPNAFAFTSGDYANNPPSPNTHPPGTPNGILAGGGENPFPLTIIGSVAAGLVLTGEFSFSYANDSTGPHTFSLFASSDGTGTALFSVLLPENGSLPGGPTYDVWTECGPTSIVCAIPITASLGAHSFVFQGGAGTAQLGVDNITLNVIPEPSTALLLGLGLASLAAAGRRVRPASI